MSSVESVLVAALKLTPAERAEFRARFEEAAATPVWPARLHPAWKEVIARRDAMPEDDDIPWEQVERELEEESATYHRERDARGED